MDWRIKSQLTTDVHKFDHFRRLKWNSFWWNKGTKTHFTLKVFTSFLVCGQIYLNSSLKNLFHLTITYNSFFFAETEGFKIDTMGTYHGMTLKSVTVRTWTPRFLRSRTAVFDSNLSCFWDGVKKNESLHFSGLFFRRILGLWCF